MRIYFFVCFLCVISSSAIAKNITDNTEFFNLCLDSVDNESVFASFRRDPIFQKFVEKTTYEEGLKCYATITSEYPHLKKFHQALQQIDNIGNPNKTIYTDFGLISPSTLQNIKIAGDIQKQFGDLSNLNILEIGGGCGALCAVLSITSGFNSYTIVNSPESNELARKFLDLLGIEKVIFIDKNSLSSQLKCDLLISNCTFSESDSEEQHRYMKYLITGTSNGYMRVNSISVDYQIESLPPLEYMAFLFKNGRKGKFQLENPDFQPQNHHSVLRNEPVNCDKSHSDIHLLTWHNADFERSIIQRRERPVLLPSSTDQKYNAVTYEFSGGRFGDNLIAYLHAKWIALKYNLPFMYRPFGYSADLNMDIIDPKCCPPYTFANHMTVRHESNINDAMESKLYIIPYFPELQFELHYSWYVYGGGPFLFQVDWDDPFFKEEMIRSLTPKNNIDTLQLPTDRITVGMHLRRGGGHDNYDRERINFPLKFPPDSYYIENLKKVLELFKDDPIYVYLMTDDRNPDSLLHQYREAFRNYSNVVFDCRSNGNGPNSNVLIDFFSISKFDCFIGSNSNFSFLATKLGNYKLLFTPMHATVENKVITIDQVDVEFHP